MNLWLVFIKQMNNLMTECNSSYVVLYKMISSLARSPVATTKKKKRSKVKFTFLLKESAFPPHQLNLFLSNKSGSFGMVSYTTLCLKV